MVSTRLLTLDVVCRLALTRRINHPYCRSCCSGVDSCLLDKLQIVEGCWDSEVGGPPDGKNPCFEVGMIIL